MHSMVSLLILLLLLFSPSIQAERPDIIIADFESGTYAGWTATGNAFGTTPAHGTLAGQQEVSGYLGEWLVNSFLNGDGTTGTLVSDTFTIERTHINFMIGGGSNTGCRIELLVGGNVVRSVFPEVSEEELKWNCWEVASWQGQSAVIRIVDNETGGWGHINVDHIVQADNLVIGGFDNGTYDGWTATGNAFGTAPATGKIGGQNLVQGFNGAGLVNTFLDGDASTGTLTSPYFTISKKFINFRLGGGFNKDLLYVTLTVNGQVVRKTSPMERVGRPDDSWQERLYLCTWDVSEFIGQEAAIEIVDNSTGGWGHINADDFIQCDYRAAYMAENINLSVVADAQFLMIPIQNEASMVSITLKTHDGSEITKTKMRLARNNVDRYMPIYIGGHLGDSIDVLIEEAYTNLPQFDLLRTSDSLNYVAPEDSYYPMYHFAPAYGWMNDPNGMVYHNGTYHLFFQHYPYDSHWNSMHWGHATSTDLVHWTQQPIGLFPDAYGDMFSGSIVVDENNTAGFGAGAFVAVYTSTVPKQNQSIAYSLDEGMTWHKYGAPVLTSSKGDFRDPKVCWYAEGNCWVLVLAAGNEAEFYTSTNLKNWTRRFAWGSGAGNHGGVWECPDLIQVPVEGTNEMKWVLIVSIGNGAPAGGSGTQYFIGDFTLNGFTSIDNSTRWLDYGKENYAGVTWSGIRDAQNRPLFIGWMNNWQYANEIPAGISRGMNTFPRALSLVNTPDGLKLKSEPVAQMDLLRSETVFEPTVGTITQAWQQTNIAAMQSSAAIIELTTGAQRQGWKMTLSNEDNQSVVCGFNATTNQVYVDRRNAGIKDFSTNFANAIHYAPIGSTENAARALVLLDRSSLELFINGGRISITDLVYPNKPYTNLSLQPENGSLEVQKLKVTAVTMDKQQEQGIEQTDEQQHRATLKMLDGHVVICTPEGRMYNLLGTAIQ